MISVLAQERLLGFALGSVCMGVALFENHRSICRSISLNAIDHQPHQQIREPIFGKKFRSEFKHMWNKAVDGAVGPVITSLSSHGW
ncbi:hypothetical protein QJS04_geneDACA002437 [Acorus gramineus]|uniref:Uncharacterized protein n=1 Tax=Acorus gramineus TaxID=55184 RepID=A0AAV9A962_ACOGR|nr:hypothetical protein QJS04_geneDACA002437 [Acorus gramineus]